MSHTDSPAAAPYTLHFKEWRCGHHGQRPADIPVYSLEQAQLILQAIANAISQPGHATVALLDEDKATLIYITDDYAEPIARLNNWNYRTEVYHGSAEDMAALSTLGQVYEEYYGGEMATWDGSGNLDEHMEVVTTLSVEEIEKACAPVEWHEEGTRKEVCSYPPVIKPAALLIAELREYQEAANASEEEGGAA